MKKILFTLSIVALSALSLVSITQADVKATLFNPITGERKVVDVGDRGAFDGGFLLETSENNYVTYWVNKITSGELQESEINLVPEQAWYEVTPQIINIVPESTELNFGSISDLDQQVASSRVCYGSDCDQYFQDSEPIFGYSVVSRYRTTLTSSMTSTQTNVPVATIQTFDGTTLTIADLGGKVFLTAEPGSAREEIVKCTAISSSIWSSCTRGLAFSGTSESSVATNRKAHNAGSIVVMSNVHYVYEQLSDKDTAETFTGIKSFTWPPLIINQPTSTGQVATWDYVNDVGAGGFTSSNIGNGLTLRANGTSPETVDINTTTTAFLSAFTVKDGYFDLATGTSSALDQYWDDRYNATTTKESLIVTTATTSVQLVVGSTSFAAPTNTLSVVGNSYFQGNATTTGELTVLGTCHGCLNSHRIVNGTPATLTTTNGAVTTATASCSSSEVITGGGFNLTDAHASGDYYVVASSSPVSSTQWSTSVECVTSGSCPAGTLTAHAICIHQ